MKSKKNLLALLFSSLIIMLLFIGHANATTSLSYPGNHCLSFDGVDDYLSCGSLEVNVYRAENLTVELWMRPEYTIEAGSDVDYGHTTGAIISYTETWSTLGGWTLHFDFSDGLLKFRYKHGYGPPITLSTNRAIWNAHSWYHIAITYETSGSLVFYVNGTIDRIHSVATLFYEASNLKVGGHPTYGHMFAGLIDEVQVWNVSRTHSEILSTWDRVLNLTECAQPELIGYWRFDEGAGDVSEDHSPQVNNAILALVPYEPTWIDFGAPIIPEFPSAFVLPLLMICTLVAVVLQKKRKHNIEIKCVTS